MLILPPLDLDATRMSTGGAGPVIELVDGLLETAVVRAPCTLEGSFHPPFEGEAEFELRPRGAAGVERVGSCPVAMFRSVLARLAVVLLDASALYGGAGHRYLRLGSREVRAILYMSNDGLSGYWFRLYCGSEAV